MSAPDGSPDAPAFPYAFEHDEPPASGFAPGFTKRQYAAIRLRVPESGLPWLDAMITRAKRDEFAGQALAGYAGTEDGRIFPGDHKDAAAIAKWRTALRAQDAEYCYSIANAMLAHHAKPEGGK